MQQATFYVLKRTKASRGTGVSGHGAGVPCASHNTPPTAFFGPQAPAASHAPGNKSAQEHSAVMPAYKVIAVHDSSTTHIEEVQSRDHASTDSACCTSPTACTTSDANGCDCHCQALIRWHSSTWSYVLLCFGVCNTKAWSLLLKICWLLCILNRRGRTPPCRPESCHDSDLLSKMIMLRLCQ